jgi:hypothetical protein
MSLNQHEYNSFHFEYVAKIYHWQMWENKKKSKVAPRNGL